MKSIADLNDQKLHITTFASLTAHQLQYEELTWDDLWERVQHLPLYEHKHACPLIKLGRFGEHRTPSGSLRSNDNLLEVSGIEGDYDQGEITLERAAEILKVNGIAAILYTSASHTPESPRWRVLCPLSKPYPRKQRRELLDWLNMTLYDKLAPESATDSQAYFFGRVQGAPFECLRVEGKPIDVARDDQRKAFGIAFERAGGKIPTKASKAAPQPTATLFPDTPVPDHIRASSPDQTTQALLPFAPRSFRDLAERSLAGYGCAQIAFMLQQPTEVREPLWFNGLSIAWACEEREQAVEQLSRGDPRYDAKEAITKAKRQPGPAKCVTIERNRPGGCTGCVYQGTITSPIQLAEPCQTLPQPALNDRDDILMPDEAGGAAELSFHTDDSCATDPPSDPPSSSPPSAPTAEQTILQLAQMTRLQYEMARKAQADRLGIRATALDELVAGQRAALEVPEVNGLDEAAVPWEEPVDATELLDELKGTIHRFIVCEPDTATAAALWIAMTWFIDGIDIAPLAIITAPEKRCGKSQLLFLMGELVRRPLEVANSTTAAVFRSIELWQPTLLMDEVDTFLKENEELRGIINAGFSRKGSVLRTVGDNHTPTQFKVFCPKALAGIGTLPDTIIDRGIQLKLRRKLSDEKVDRLRDARQELLFPTLQRKLARLAIDHLEAVREARPQLPTELNDRAQDLWEPMIAIADLAGPIWGTRARDAAVSLSGQGEELPSLAVELLQDIRDLLEGISSPTITSATLLKKLCEDQTLRWATYNRGFEITPKQVASRLKDFGIEPRTVRNSDNWGPPTAKGYRREHFIDAFARYLPDAFQGSFLSMPTMRCDAPSGFGVLIANQGAADRILSAQQRMAAMQYG